MRASRFKSLRVRRIIMMGVVVILLPTMVASCVFWGLSYGSPRSWISGDEAGDPIHAFTGFDLCKGILRIYHCKFLGTNASYPPSNIGIAAWKIRFECCYDCRNVTFPPWLCEEATTRWQLAVDQGRPNARQHRLQLPLWIPLILSALMLVPFVRHFVVRQYRTRQGLCLTCGYCLKDNVSGLCPECGDPLPSGRPEDDREGFA